jgi:hypothetical protein
MVSIGQMNDICVFSLATFSGGGYFPDMKQMIFEKWSSIVDSY